MCNEPRIVPFVLFSDFPLSGLRNVTDRILVSVASAVRGIDLRSHRVSNVFHHVELGGGMPITYTKSYQIAYHPYSAQHQHMNMSIRGLVLSADAYQSTGTPNMNI